LPKWNSELIHSFGDSFGIRDQLLVPVSAVTPNDVRPNDMQRLGLTRKFGQCTEMTFFPNLHFSATLVPGRGVRRIPHLASLLPMTAKIVASTRLSGDIDSVAGWGFKPTSLATRRLAAQHGLPYLALEDGFFRSVGLGESGAMPLGLVVDDLGIYYDARQPSRLEHLLATAGWETADLIARAEAAIDFVVRHGLSKTNAEPPLAPTTLLKTGRRRILIIDQTLGDASIEGALASPATFQSMITAARLEEPAAELIVRRHPATAAGLKSGCLGDDDLEGVTLLDGPARIADVLAQVDAVYTVSSLTGFEALLRGIPVRCFGMPFYAGWGLTRDEIASPRRGKLRSVAELFAAACILYSHYIDPLTGAPCSLETALERLLQFRDHSEANAGHTAALGFTPWKRAVTRKHLSSARGTIAFHNDVDRAIKDAQAAGGRIVVWGGKETVAMRDRLSSARVRVERMEDGFIRSAGLGSDFNLAASVVLDRLGIYYDATRPSRLEDILQNSVFDQILLGRARSLRSLIVDRGISKYNVGESGVLNRPPGRQAILVVGQVEDDKSIELGCRGLKTNLSLIEQVRREFPSAFIFYKPHPDVASGNRKGQVSNSDALRFADMVVGNIDITVCLRAVDRLATLTSLAGFEALLRGVPVTTYGLPFYAGWGLTEDHVAIARRTRQLTLDELVAGTLISYPQYISPTSGLPCGPEHLVELFATAPARSRKTRRLRYFHALLESIRKHPSSRY
jgi:capsular polysaccharide export protein